MLFQQLLLLIWSILPSTLATPQDHFPHDFNFSTLQTVSGTQNLENLAIRQNGDILVTSTTSGVIHQVSAGNATPSISIAQFPVLALLGIAELEQDVFYVAGSNISGGAATPGTNRVWRVDMNPFQASANGTILSPARVSLVANFPEVGTLNGMTTLDKDHVLIADSSLGTITKLNVQSGEYSIFANDSTMAPLSTDNGYLGIGVNGIHTLTNKLYYTSLDQGLFASINLDCPSEPAEIIATGIVAGDDFAITKDGKTAFIANNGEFTLTEVYIPGKSGRLLNSTFLQTASSAAFGRGSETVLYVTGAMSLCGNETVGRVAVGVPKV